jgi:hypothetical protein
MQVFVREHFTMIATSVQGDVDGIPKGSHYVRVPTIIGQPNRELSRLTKPFELPTIDPVKVRSAAETLWQSMVDACKIDLTTEVLVEDPAQVTVLRVRR